LPFLGIVLSPISVKSAGLLFDVVEAFIMVTLVRALVVVFPLLLTALAGTSHGNAAEPVLLDQREIELPEMRILSLSPDVSAIAAASLSLDRLCIYETESLAERICTGLAPLEAGLRMDDVVWSPDSARIVLAEQAYVRFVDGDLWLMDAVTGELTNVTDDGVTGRIPILDTDEVEFTELFIDVSPTWLPDSSGITFSRSTWRDGEWLGNTTEIIPVTGGESRLLLTVSTDTPGVVYYGMRWAADTKRLFYSVCFADHSNPNNGIWSTNAEGSGNTQLLRSDPDYGPPFIAGLSLLGETVLAYYPAAAGNLAAPKRPMYSVIDVASGEITPIEVLSSGGSEYVFARPVVLSPDGTVLTYAGRLTTPDFLIYARTIASSVESLLIPEGLPGAAPITLTAPVSWSHDGHVLLLNSPDKGTILHIPGGVDLALIAATPDSATPEASPFSTPESMYIEPGATVFVNDNDVPLRSAPDTDAQTVAVLSAGMELTVMGPQVDADGHTWVPVTDPQRARLDTFESSF